MILSRTSWTASIPKSNVGAEDTLGTPYFRPSEVTGISFLTPGEDVSFVELNPYSYLESYLRNDFSKNGFGDIAYNLAVSPNVKGVFCLRGLCNKSAAHRDKQNNSSNVAVLVLVGREEPPTDLLLQNLITCREFILSKFPNAVNGLSTLPFTDFWNLEVPEEKFKCQLPESYIPEPGVHVHDLIENLAYWGYYRARNDGVYGPVCYNAVMELQADLAAGEFYRHRVDGSYGRFTRDAFCRYLNSFGH